jgi:putative oxidoreductase
MHYRILDLRETHQFVPAILQMVAAGAGVLLLVGLWTPVGGALVAIAELWIACSRAGDPWIPIILATLGATLAMIGPGAWSIDARLFGRKHIDLPESQ